MAKFTDETAKTAFAPYLEPAETVQETAYGVKQPHIMLIILLTLLGVLPGVLFATFAAKHYLVGMTERRFIVLRIGMSSKLKVKDASVYPLNELSGAKVSTSENALFTNIKIIEPDRRFVAKFHRAYSKVNRPNAQAIAQRLSAA